MGSKAQERTALIAARRFAGGEISPVTLPVIREVPLTVFYNGREIITLLATPDHHLELAVGFLKSEGFLEQPADLLGHDLDEEKGMVRITGRASGDMVSRLMEKRTITSGCGKGTTFYHAVDALQVKAAGDGFAMRMEEVVDLVAGVNRTAMAGREAGGVHHAALAGREGVAVIMEDIGRHNAIDKIQGHCFLRGVATDDKFLMSTGRVSSEILIKAAKMGVPLVVSLSKASSLALELAERLRISVVGNVRGRQGLIYKDFGRLT